MVEVVQAYRTVYERNRCELDLLQSEHEKNYERMDELHENISHLKRQNKKLRKLNTAQMKELKKAKDLFRDTLSVKM